MDYKKGVLTGKYHLGRERKIALKYRLERRTNEVLKAIKTYKENKDLSILDIGTADALMLDKLDKKLNIGNPVGLDFSLELLRCNINQKIKLIRGDAVMLPIEKETFDVIIATAVIEHVYDVKNMLDQCRSILKKNGIIIITTPVPLFESIATKIGHLDDEQHQKTFNLEELSSLLKSVGFDIMKKERFMISPIGLPFEDQIENIMRFFRLDFLFSNQLIIGQKII